MASPSPYVSRTSRIFSHHPSQNPPLRPLGPPPQMSVSSSTTSRSGCRSFRNHAVHMPVYPPPRITTSAVVSRRRGGASGPANSGSASASSSHHERSAGRGASLRGIASLSACVILLLWPRPSALRYRANPSFHVSRPQLLAGSLGPGPSGGHRDGRSPPVAHGHRWARTRPGARDAPSRRLLRGEPRQAAGGG